MTRCSDLDRGSGTLIRKWQELDGALHKVALCHPSPAAHLRLALVELRPYLLASDDNWIVILATMDQLERRIEDLRRRCGGNDPVACHSSDRSTWPL